MNQPTPRSINGWGVAVYPRGKHHAAVIRSFVGQQFIHPTREGARAEARRVRCLGLCATPIRVRVTIEAKAEG